MMDATSSDVQIRRYRPDDVEPFYEAAHESIHAMQPWMPWCHAGYTIDEARQWVDSQPSLWESGEAKEFIITDTTGRYLGGCGLNGFSAVHRSANLGYWLRLSARGRGVATQAVRLLQDWAFRETDLDRLEIRAAVGNVASQRVAAKAGAIREGLLRQELLLNGQRHDTILFSLLRTDWRRDSSETGERQA